MFGKFKSSGAGTPAWLRWAVIAVLAYMFFISYQNRQSDDTVRTASYDDNYGEVVRTTPGDTFTKAGNRVVNQRQEFGIQVGGDIEGRGANASCGEIAEVSVSTLLPDNIALSDDQKKRYIPIELDTVKVGLHNEDAMWAAGIIGMKTGGVREVLVPAFKVFGDDMNKSLGLDRSSKMRYKITLNSLSPKHPDGTMPYRAMDNSIGRGTMAGCGSTIKANVTIWNAKAEKVFTSVEPLTFTLGNGTYSYGLDRGILGMRPKSRRTLTIPPAYQVIGDEMSKLLQKNELQQKFKTDETLTVDVTVVSVEKP